MAWVHLLEKRSIKDRTFIYKNVIGVSDLSLAEHFIKTFHIPLSPTSLLAEKRKEFLKIMKEEPIDASIEKKILSQLQREYTLAVVSSSHSDEIEFVLEKMGIRSFFSHIVAGNHVHHHKPDPEPYIKALQELHLTADEAIVIEDSFPGISSALGADLAVIWLNRYLARMPPLENVFPIQSFAEIPEVLSINRDMSTL